MKIVLLQAVLCFFGILIFALLWFHFRNKPPSSRFSDISSRTNLKYSNKKHLFSYNKEAWYFYISHKSYDITPYTTHRFRRFNVQRNGDWARRASREKGSQTIGCSGASYSQSRVGAPWHQVGQYSRVQERFLADQTVRLRRDQKGEHGGASAQRVAAILATRGTADRHWRDVQVIIRLTIISNYRGYFSFLGLP